MPKSEADIIRRLQGAAVGREELIEILEAHPGNYRIRLHLIQHPKFPTRLALDILVRLYPVDLVKVIKNTRANPFVRRRAGVEFTQRYQKLALGEKVALLKTAPNALLEYLSDENHPTLLETILKNPNCTEETVLRMIGRPGDRSVLYAVLSETEWFRWPAVARAVARDQESPIRILLEVVSLLPLDELQRLYSSEKTHTIVRERIRQLFENRHSEK